MKKILTLAIISILSLFVFIGCSSSPTDNDSQSNSQGNKIKITHSKGETEVPVNPKKVVAFDLGILDMINSLNIETEVAVPTSLPKSLSKYEGNKTVGSVKEPDIEAIHAFAPEVIFISGRQADYYDELSKIAPTVYVDLNAASYMNDFSNNVTNIGNIFGKAEEAKNKLAEITAKVDEAKKKASESNEKALIILTNNGSISAYGKGSRFGFIHDVLGVKTADEKIEVSTHGQEANYEYISKINPDILFVVDRTAVVGGEKKANATLENDLVKTTKAAKNNKIVYLDADAWYLVGGGISTVETMVKEVTSAL